MKCPVCSNESFIFMEGIFDCDKTLVRECKNCKLHFLDPIMSLEEEENYYKNYYENQKIRQKKKYSLKDIQQNALSHYNEYYETYYDLIKDANNILEIGSGSGGFLKFIDTHTNNKNIYSIEKSESNVEFLRDEFEHVTFCDSVNELENVKFDVIVAFGVFEHIRDLHGFLSELKHQLKDANSKIIFNVPNNNDVLISFFNLEEYKKFMYMKQHYYVFSKESFSHIAKNVGLTVKKINFIQAWGIDNHLSWLNERKAQDFSHYSTQFSTSLNKEYKKNLIDQETTDLIMVTFSKGEL